mgnify:CR=1 FL=1
MPADPAATVPRGEAMNLPQPVAAPALAGAEILFRSADDAVQIVDGAPVVAHESTVIARLPRR